jgi:hypothetical protein
MRIEMLPAPGPIEARVGKPFFKRFALFPFALSATDMHP